MVSVAVWWALYSIGPSISITYTRYARAVPAFICCDVVLAGHVTPQPRFLKTHAAHAFLFTISNSNHVGLLDILLTISPKGESWTFTVAVPHSANSYKFAVAKESVTAMTVTALTPAYTCHQSIEPWSCGLHGAFYYWLPLKQKLVKS